MSEHRSSDRRKYHRIATDQVISFAELDRPVQQGLSRDISKGGIRFEAVGIEISLGELLRVTFHVGDATVVATGEVVWATDLDALTQEIGIEFHEVDPEAVRLLEEIVEPEVDVASGF